MFGGNCKAELEPVVLKLLKIKAGRGGRQKYPHSRLPTQSAHATELEARQSSLGTIPLHWRNELHQHHSTEGSFMLFVPRVAQKHPYLQVTLVLPRITVCLFFCVRIALTHSLQTAVHVLATFTSEKLQYSVIQSLILSIICIELF